MSTYFTKELSENFVKEYSKPIEQRVITPGMVYGGKIVISANETMQQIGNYILKKEPFWIGRFGGTEMSCINYYVNKNIKPLSVDRTGRHYVRKMHQYSGFFPLTHKNLSKFTELMISTMADIDMLGVWNLKMEEWYLENIMSNTTITKIGFLEPWACIYDYNTPLESVWTQKLAGLKVLVIHPFAETIRKQYVSSREKLFTNIAEGGLLPEFELKTIKAVQSLAGEKTEYKSWFSALDSMCEKCAKEDFDVAIIGCGAYGWPLAAEIKKMGKGAIHLGGATQLLFGISGKRWDSGVSYGSDDVRHIMMNEYWVRPGKSERIKRETDVENGAYW